MEKNLHFSIIDNIYRWATATPDAIALQCRELSISYRELISVADRLATYIYKNGDSCPFIGLSATKTADTIIGMVGIIQSGKAYLPLDREYPVERIAQMVEDASVKYIVCDHSEREFFAQFGLTALSVSDASLDEHTTNLILPGAGELIALLYTSGSTGVPKGVCLTHDGMHNLIKHQLLNSKAESGLQNLLFSHLSFDASFQEIFSSLASGGTLHIIDEATRLDALQLLGYLDQYAINRVFLPYVTLQHLTETAQRINRYPGSLVEVTTGGELLKLTPAIRDFFTRMPDCTLVNAYGPTEASVWVTDNRLTGPAADWPDIPSIGRPIPHAEILLLDSEGQEALVGEIGEIHIGGISVAAGYLNREELTQERFITQRATDGRTLRLYRTGDLGRLSASGEIEFHGRADNQVKIRGNRVELAEIEICLAELPQVSQSVVLMREDSPGVKRLVAYLISTDGKPKDISPLRTHLEMKLPNYMIPAAFVWLSSFPKAASGKIDRKALPIPETSRPDVGTLYKAPTTENEKRIAALWASLLLVDKVGIDDNFFELGGNSLLAQKTVVELQLLYQMAVGITKIYQYPTVAQLAAAIDSKPTMRATPKAKSISKYGGDGAIAIIGLAGRFPGASTIDELWELLCEGKETISTFSSDELDESVSEELRNDPNYVMARGIIDAAEQFDPGIFGLSPTVAKLMDPQHRIFLEICRDVLETSGYLLTRNNHVIGVYGGSNSSTYFLNNLQYHPEEIAKIGQFQTTLLNEREFLSTRTAYQLNLRGPALTVNTACSTSLVAVAQAVDAIRRGQCEMAIAGGISIHVPIKSGQRHEEGAMFSKDGHTRTFDAQATGTVFSDGAGVVLLKSLEDAKADGDKIYAVIRGVGLSNDGGGKGSFMAPSAIGQAEAIRMAMDDAGFSSETIGYIEAHGTATPLGDPIEIEGLKLAFGDVAEKQYCRIGSIKSNMGHLTHAAGVAGLIKAALSLYHRTIPPSINFSQPNPNITFSETPFIVNDSLFSWEAGKRFRMGVSSFGVGGTNAHAVLENYVSDTEDENTPSPTDRPSLIVWSTKTEESGSMYAVRLLGFLKQDPTVSLNRLSYTLQATREPLGRRYMVVADSHSQLVDRLASGQQHSYNLQEKAGNLVFLFPGQGAQYVNMGRILYQSEPIYRMAFDECADILLKEIGEDIRTVIFSADSETGGEALRNTYYTQPALFITSYALAKLWMSWGVKPTAFVGHSIGEFVAAHLAGVFSLEDALRIIAIRGKLSSSIPTGSMLSVRTAAERITPLLPKEVSIAAVNAPNLCVVAGPNAEITEFIDLLATKEIPCKILQTSHAFHSSMMAPIVDAFKAEVASVTLNIPKIPIVSTVTGNWLKDEQATDPEYWASHIIATVKFSNAIKFIEHELSPIYLEAGPGQVMSTLVKQHGTDCAKRAFSSLYRSEEGEYTTLIQALGNIWLRGIDPQWENVYHEGSPRIIHDLPTYAYDKNPYWVGSKSSIKSTEKKHSDKINPAMRKDLLINKVKELLEEASGIDIADAPLQANFIEIGLDSLLLTQIAQSLKKAFGVPVTFRMLNDEYNNLDLLGNYLDAQLPPDAFQQPAETNAATVAEVSSPPASVSFPIPQQLPNPGSAMVTSPHWDAISLISQQISLISQQITLLQGGTNIQPSVFSHTNNHSVSQKEQSIPQKTATPVSAIKNQSDLSLAPEEVAELKKPFGATARIDKQATELNETQSRYLTDLTERYVAQTARSKAYTQKHRTHMADPRVVSGFKPTTKELVYSIVTNRSKGCRLWDIDGNEYIDALNGFGSNMLGYQPDFIAKALHQQIDEGYEIGPQHEKAGEVCELICELTRMERAALCNTGSEAVLGAMRIARTVTGRSTIVAFSNSYHGIVDEVIVRGTKKLKTFPAASGIMPEAVQNMLILDYGSPEALEIIREKANDIAAILVEPIQSRRPEFQPVEFVRELRDITAESGIVLVFDEVITGFRMHLHGMQHVWGIEADLATYGKVVGGGMSIGVIAGKSTFMDALDGGHWAYGDSSVPEVGVTYFAGTFVRHPLTLAATKASLEYLKKQGSQLQENLTKRANSLADELNKICRKYRTPIFVAQFGSLWKVKYHREFPYSELLFVAMRLRGIHIHDGFPCFLTTAHTDEDIQQIISAFEVSVHELVKAGFIPTDSNEDIISIPPVPNARLGKDANGNAAWFVQDENDPKKYLQVVTP